MSNVHSQHHNLVSRIRFLVIILSLSTHVSTSIGSWYNRIKIKTNKKKIVCEEQGLSSLKAITIKDVPLFP